MKSKIFSLINIFGLTAGLTICLMIFLFIINEFSVDNFHVNAKNIYRVMRGTDPASPSVPFVSSPYAPALLNDFPGEIKQAVRVMPNDAALILYNNKPFYEKHVIWADSNFFTVFSFPLLRGNPATALTDPNSIVLTESTAKKYFGDEDPMGKILELDRKVKLMVTGIMKDVPANSTLQFNFVTSLNFLIPKPFMKNWTNNSDYIYLVLDEHARKENIEKRLPAFMDRYMGREMQKMGIHFYLSLTPLRDIYLENASVFDNVRHGDKKVVYIFLSIAILILLIACINFMNLSTIRAVDRGKEVGLRKVMGALRSSLTSQFLCESVLLALISSIISFGLLLLLMPAFNNLLGYKLPIPYTAWYLYAFLGGAALVVGLLAGSYPALVLSGFSPIEALKGKLRLGKGGSFLRQGLVIVQFSISVFLITSTIIILRQMSYIKNKDLGFDQDQTLVIRFDNSAIYNHMDMFRKALLSNSNIKSSCLMTGEPGGYFDSYAFEVEDQNHPWLARTEFTDFEFVKTLGLKIIAGRDLSAQYPTDTLAAVLINRLAATSLGFTPETAIGKWIRNTTRDSTRRRIVGVVENFNYTSLKQSIEPLVIAPNPGRNVALVKINAGNLTQGIEAAKEAYAAAVPGITCEYTFLDQKFDLLYSKDIRQQHILTIFSGLAILVACLGLFGLTTFTTARRTKEIGIRKVLGSTVQNVTLLLSKELLRPVILATLIALPIAYFIMYKWLQNFAYHIGMQWWIFILSAAITFAIALCTVAFKTIKAAIAAPADSLRSE